MPALTRQPAGDDPPPPGAGARLPGGRYRTGPSEPFVYGPGDEHYHDIPAVVLAHIREGKPGFDSVICGNDRIAFMVYQTLLGRGLRIPQDVAVVGYDNMVGIGDLFLPPLSTVQLPHYDIGRLSALHIIHGDNHRETRKVASPWLPRASH